MLFFCQTLCQWQVTKYQSSYGFYLQVFLKGFSDVFLKYSLYLQDGSSAVTLILTVCQQGEPAFSLTSICCCVETELLEVMLLPFKESWQLLLWELYLAAVCIQCSLGIGTLQPSIVCFLKCRSLLLRMIYCKM